MLSSRFTLTNQFLTKYKLCYCFYLTCYLEVPKIKCDMVQCDLQWYICSFFHLYLKFLKYNKEWRLEEFNTHRAHQKQEKQRQAGSNQLGKLEWMNVGTNTTKRKTVIKEKVWMRAKRQEAVEANVWPHSEWKVFYSCIFWYAGHKCYFLFKYIKQKRNLYFYCILLVWIWNFYMNLNHHFYQFWYVFLYNKVNKFTKLK